MYPKSTQATTLPLTSAKSMSPADVWDLIGDQAFPCAVILFVVLAMMFHGPIQQLADYHHFADTRAWFGIPNAADVISNLGFALAGIFGIGALWKQQANPQLVAGRSGYALFFSALVLTACGSSWYHLAPDNARLVFDRLPIALACAGLLAAVWHETLGGSRWLTPTLAIFGVLSVIWWRYMDLSGAGDLRPYLLMQILPLVLIPLLQLQHQSPRRDRIAFGAMILLYALAKAFELADHSTLASLGLISGHTLKHLLATFAAATVVWSVAYRGEGSC